MRSASVPRACGSSGGSPAGVYYAFQTIRQLLPEPVLRGEKAGVVELPVVEIADQPYFAYRGGMLDVGRHFFSVDDVKEFIDILAMHKINRFHWHLTEDHGWRIEIKKYPELTRVGAFRDRCDLDPAAPLDSVPYGGFYTQDEVKEIVRYATDRFITVIPEIEMPGHSTAALASYPYLGCRGEDYKVSSVWGVKEDVYCAGNDSTFAFLEGVLTEVVDLFPSEYIHIGGDECPKVRWKACPKCQKRIRDEKLKDEFELQSYFVQRMEKFLERKRSEDRRLGRDHGRRAVQDGYRHVVARRGRRHRSGQERQPCDHGSQHALLSGLLSDARHRERAPGNRRIPAHRNGLCARSVRGSQRA